MKYELPVGAKVKFLSEKRPYTVQASDARFAVCTKPFNPKRTVLYTVIDLKQGIRGTENLIFGMGAETRQQCEEMLDRLNGRYLRFPGGNPFTGPIDKTPTKVSHRNWISLDIEWIRNEVKQ